MNITGLYYFDNILDQTFYDELLHFVQNCEMVPVTAGSENSRLVAHFGRIYNYKSSSISHSKASPMPQILQKLIAKISQQLENVPEIESFESFNSCIINQYLPGQGINKHVDSTNFGPVIACVTIGSGVEIEFSKNSGEQNYKFCFPIAIWLVPIPTTLRLSPNLFMVQRRQC